MASQVLSGSSNPTYTNNTGQNVRLLMNYISNCTSMTWAGVTINRSTSSTVGKDIMTIHGELRSATAPTNNPGDMTILPSVTQGTLTSSGGSIFNPTPASIAVDSDLFATFTAGKDSNPYSENIFYVPLSISPGGDFPSELVLASGQAFSAQSGAFNIVVIKEDGT